VAAAAVAKMTRHRSTAPREERSVACCKRTQPSFGALGDEEQSSHDEPPNQEMLRKPTPRHASDTPGTMGPVLALTLRCAFVASLNPRHDFRALSFATRVRDWSPPDSHGVALGLRENLRPSCIQRSPILVSSSHVEYRTAVQPVVGPAPLKASLFREFVEHVAQVFLPRDVIRTTHHVVIIARSGAAGGRPE